MVCSPRLCKGPGLGLFLTAQNSPVRKRIAVGATLAKTVSPQAPKRHSSAEGIDGRVRREGNKEMRVVLHAARPCKLTQYFRVNICPGAIVVEIGSKLLALGCTLTLPRSCCSTGGNLVFSFQHTSIITRIWVSAFHFLLF